MDSGIPKHLLPTLPMLAECLSEVNWEYEMVLSDEHQSYRGIRLYHPWQKLQKDVIYLLRPEEQNFPVDDYSYLSTGKHPGKANHLSIPGQADEEIMDQFLEVFSRFWEWEDSINLLLYRNASLQELVELASRLLENPVCVHDDWFVMMATTPEFSRIMEPEFLMSSAKGFVPRAVVEDFLYDSDYLETYTYHEAQIWDAPERRFRALYANLWDGPVYKGRLLIARKNRDFLRRDFLLAEVLAQRTALLLRRKRLDDGSLHQNMDEIVFSLLKGEHTEPADLMQLMNLLHWQNTDRFLCLRIREQQRVNTVVLEHMLHGDLFRSFPGSYILMDGREQSVVVDLTRMKVNPAEIRHILAPLCRDYCLYAGISSPVQGIRELPSAYYQAGAALDQAFRLHSEKWILAFSECAMEHMLRNIPSPLTPGSLIAPDLTELMAYDKTHDTPYFETLRAYLIHERDIPRTAEALIIHRTTLLYRLKKIRSIIHTDLEDPWQRMYLMLSLWILERGKEG